MADFLRHLERADKYLEKGKSEAALNEFLEALELEPNNEQVLSRAGDLALALGNTPRAVELLSSAFSLYLGQPNLAKAKVAYRKLERLKFFDADSVRRYAELLTSTSRKEAADVFQVAAKLYRQKSLPKEALACLASAIDLVPRADLLRTQAELALETNQKPLASTAMVRLGMVLEKEGVDPGESYAKGFEYDPENLAAKLAYGRVLVDRGRAEKAVELLRPLATYPSAPMEARDPYARALLSLNRVLEAEPYLWGLFESDPPRHLETLVNAVGGLVSMGENERGLALAQRLEEYQRRAGQRGQFIEQMAQMANTRNLGAEFLEYLALLYDGANQEREYGETLFRLFGVYFAEGNYSRAYDSVDRAIEVDCYDARLKNCLDQLIGKVDEARLASLYRRAGLELEQAGAESKAEESALEESAPPPVVLEDLIVQGELFLQYQMRERAVEKIREIQDLFPSEELEGNERFRDLMRNAGLAHEIDTGEAAKPETGNLFSRAVEIGRLLSQQTDARALISTAVNELGRQWDLSRCLGVLGLPGQAPTAVVEFCSVGVPRSQRAAMVKLVAAAQQLTQTQPLLAINEVAAAELVADLRPELDALSIRSLLMVAVLEGGHPGGWLVLEQCDTKRAWTSEETASLRSLADQISLALQGIRLRSLVRTLGVTDERSGLLNRASYLDVLLAEVHRSRTSGACVTVVLLELRPEKAVNEERIKAVSSIIQGLLRATAVNFRYGANTLALVLPGTTARSASALLAEIRTTVQRSTDPDMAALSMSSVVAEAIRGNNFEEEDIVTELINRADRALASARNTPGVVSIVLPDEPISPSTAQ